MIEEHIVLKHVSLIGAVGLALRSLEWLSYGHEWANEGFFDSTACRIRFEDYLPRSRELLVRLVSPHVFLIVLMVQLISASACIFLPFEQQTIPLSFIVATNFVFHVRTRYGLDGSDHMLLLLFPPLLIACALGGNQAVVTMSIVFVALQGCLAYSTSGLAKMCGRSWRKGTALCEILNTRSFGWRPAAVVLRSQPRLAKGLVITTIFMETFFPISMVAPYPVVLLFIGWGILFHIVNAFVMRLNLFPWAFTASYPAVLFTSRMVWP